jgi:hypothetical protein
MALFIESEVRAAARRVAQPLYKTADTILRESRQTSRTSFDVFLSHSRLDSEVILGVKAIIENTGQTVYVDWVDDPHLDRSHVTSETAAQLRVRMRQSKSLFYVHSPNASTSKWMPWELGYFDGFNGNVAILPVVQSESSSFRGTEYLGLYPYVDLTGRNSTNPGTIYIHKNNLTYARFADWRTMTDKLRPAA